MVRTKIIFIITQSEIGGAQRWLFDTVTHLPKDKYEIVVASQPGPLLEKLTSLGHSDQSEESLKIKTNPLKHLIRPINPVQDLLGIIELYRLIKKERPEIIQLCSTKAGLLGAIAGKLVGVKKIIYRIGGWSFNDPRPHWKNKIFFWIEKISAPLKDIIIVNSQHDYDQAIKLKITNKNKLFLIYNGIKLDNIGYDPKKTSAKNRTAVPESHFKINTATIANFYPTKGLKYLIESIKILQTKNYKIKTIIIGDGPQRPELENLIKKYNLQDTIQLAGQQTNPWQYLSTCDVDIFVIPSVKEGLPYVLLEAMAAGLPIIATQAGGIPEIIKDQKNGLFIPPKNPTAIAQALEILIKNSNLKNQIARQAKIDIKKYSLENMVAQIDNLYKK